MLCLPILNRAGAIVGVLQLLNKSTGPFNIEDTDFLRAISVHCALGSGSTPGKNSQVSTGVEFTYGF